MGGLRYPQNIRCFLTHGDKRTTHFFACTFLLDIHHSVHSFYLSVNEKDKLGPAVIDSTVRLSKLLTNLKKEVNNGNFIRNLTFLHGVILLWDRVNMYAILDGLTSEQGMHLFLKDTPIENSPNAIARVGWQ
jgi:hypothetical protein